MINQIKETVAFLNKAGFDKPSVGIVLGTGLGKLVNEINIITEIAYSEIPHFPIATVESHSGRLIYGELNGKKVIAMSGRFHFYEGYSMQQITFPIRVMKFLGVTHLILSNAAGAINLNFSKGSLMLIDDHINLLPGNPLIGKNDNELGSRFPDMSAPYDKTMNGLLKTIAQEENITLHEGVYVAVSGPNLETRAEYRYLKTIGADVVGMSTVPEVIVANHMGLPCSAISVLTDECDPDNLHPVDIADIIAIAAKAEDKLIVLIKKMMLKI
jgi:purine-nucleoside phosphorylase